MKDIDFEELDRAVSSVLGTDTPKDDSQAAADSSSISQPSEVVASTDASGSTTLPAQKTLIQKRSAGRFMDVVHPSSDMKVQNKPSISRQAAAIKPLSAPAVKDEMAQSLVEDSSSTEMPDLDDKKTVVSVADMRAMPDPLESHGEVAAIEDEREDALAPEASEFNPAPDELVATDTLDQAASELAELASIMKEDTDTVPLDTPFVSGSAVEKRPLGAFSVGETDMGLLSDEAKSHLDAKNPEAAESTPSIDEEMKQAMEAALAGDAETETAAAVARMKDTDEASTSQPDQEQDDARAELDAQTILDAQDEIVPEELKSDVVAIESQEVGPTVATMSTGSIAPQYTEKKTVQSEEVAPVFDTTDYHAPIKHAEKKKSGWSGVVVVIILALVGAGIGAAVYYFDLLNVIIP